MGLINLQAGFNVANGTLNFGINSRTNFGQINLGGAAVLTGTVSANLNNGFQPVAGDSFSVLSYGSETGIFTKTNLPVAAVWQTNYAATVFTLLVLNARPSFTPIPTQFVDELTTLTVTNKATDPDVTQTITYGLLQAPPGMTLNTNTGVMTWTPAQTNSPSTNLVVVFAMDNGTPPLRATNAFLVIVREVNIPPTLSLIPTQTVNELTLLTVTNAAGELNIHSTTAGYALIGPPAGMTISASGIITWTPSQLQSPGTNLITTVVSNANPYDLVNPHLRATNTFTVIVKEVNIPPVLPVIPNQTIYELSQLTVVNTATESNIHATLSYSLVNAPAGASISSSGIITWTPTHAQRSTTNVITTIVTNTDIYDQVNLHLSATNSFTVIVLPGLVLNSPRWLGNGRFQFSFDTVSGSNYTIQYSTTLTNWISALTVQGFGGSLTIIDPNAGSTPNRFYRVCLGP
jgi:hypothetical protein